MPNAICIPRLLKQLGRYDALIIDDLGYVQYDREEMEVRFNLMAFRYERGSVTRYLGLSPRKGKRKGSPLPVSTAGAMPMSFP